MRRTIRMFWILTKMKTFEPRARDAGRKPRIVCLDNEVEGDDEDAVEEGWERMMEKRRSRVGARVGREEITKK